MRTLHWLLSLGALFTVACSGGDFAPASRLTGLRLIAVQADKPSAEPGDEVHLDAIYHDEEGRSLRFGYAFCDATASSAALDCLRATDVDTLVTAQDDASFSFTMPAPSGPMKRDSALGVVVVVCPGEIVPGDTNGIPLACEVDGEPLDVNEFELGVKRIFFAGETPNHNPNITALRWDGQAWPEDEVKEVDACDRDTDELEDCKAAFRHTIEIEADGASEDFVDAQGNPSTEQAVAQFYATGGTFEYDVRTLDSAETRWVAQKSDAGRTLTLHFVVRDTRGGVTWQTRTVRVRD